MVKDKIDALGKDKGKSMVGESQEQKPHSNNFVYQEAEEFLKIIKRSGYRVVD